MSLDTFNILDEDTIGASAHKVLVVHKDGLVDCYSESLDVLDWSTHISSTKDSTSMLQVIHASVISVGAARQAFLKGREDLLATLGPAEGAYNDSLLLTISRSAKMEDAGNNGPLELKVFDIQVTTQLREGLSFGGSQKLKPLVSLPIPEPTQGLSENPTITLHTASGTLYQTDEGVLTIYDFTSLIPRVAHGPDLRQNTASSYLRISSNLFASSWARNLSIVSLPYGSIQAESKIAEMEASRKRGEETNRESNLRLVSYFAPLDIALALEGRRLLAIQLSAMMPWNGDSRKRRRDGLLMNSIGRGPSTTTNAISQRELTNRKIKSIGTYIVPPSARGNWDQHKTELDRCVLQSDEERFESIAILLLGLMRYDREKPELQLEDHSHIDQHGVYNVLNRIFSINESQDDNDNDMTAASRNLKIVFFPHNICDWLMKSGMLTVANIEKSLKRSGAIPITSNLATGMVVRAFAERDDSLELLSKLVHSVVPLSSGELVHVLALVTRDSDAVSSTESPHLVTDANGTGNESDVQMQLTNGETMQTSSSPPPTSSNSKISRRILLTAMQKLYPMPSSSITKALRTELSPSQLRLLVDALRMEIAQNGWLSPYSDSLSAPTTTQQQESQDHNDHHISHIAHLLNCTIDSIGTGGWMLGVGGGISSDDFADSVDTIGYMKAEISAALEGIEEAMYLKGILGEMLICGKDALNNSQTVKPSKSSPDRLYHNNVVPPQLPKDVKPVTVALEEVSNILPLGLKTAQQQQGVSTMKVGAGGELQKRSMRDIGRLKSRMVGKYSFERILI